MRHGEEAAGKVDKQIPRGLNLTPTTARAAVVGDPVKPNRNDKNEGLVTAHPSTSSGQALKVRPFKTRSDRVFQQPLKPCPFKSDLSDSLIAPVKKPVVASYPICIVPAAMFK